LNLADAIGSRDTAFDPKQTLTDRFRAQGKQYIALHGGGAILRSGDAKLVGASARAALFFYGFFVSPVAGVSMVGCA
jgi:hypothetical protein